MVGSKNTLPTLRRMGPATKTRYPPYEEWGRQQKHVTHPTKNGAGNKNTLPTLRRMGPAAKRRYPPYEEWSRQQKHVTHPTKMIIDGIALLPDFDR